MGFKCTVSKKVVIDFKCTISQELAFRVYAMDPSTINGSDLL